MRCNNCNATQATPLLSCPDTGVCGTPFNPTCLTWKPQVPTALYADKVFSAHRAVGSSMFYTLDTSATPDNFLSVYELTPCNAGGCCPTNLLSEDAVFEIQNTYVQLDCLSVAGVGGAAPTIPADNVTVNGTAVCGITEEGGRFTADISCLMAQLMNPTCTAQGLPSKAFLLLQDIGNLQFRIRIGIEGVVRSCGILYRFKAYIANNEAIALPGTLTTSFAVAEVNIPCIENGAIPVITFRFDGRAELINPVITATPVADATACESVTLNITGTLAMIPQVSVEVIRNTLLLVDGAELQDCTSCGLDGFTMFAGASCCDPDPTPAPTPAPVRPTRCVCQAAANVNRIQSGTGRLGN